MLRPLRDKLKKALGRPVEYVIGGHSILLPPEHALPAYQAVHLQYDRFLPHLARQLPAGGVVVDVGANCGDTLAAMLGANPQLHYICVEADASFYDLLERNAERLRRAVPGASIELHRAFAGAAIHAVALSGTGGTRHAVAGAPEQGASGLRTIALDHIVAHESAVCLLKSDVDGFDFDVIDSGRDLIRRREPLLYFECDCSHSHRLDGFDATLGWLERIGYTRWTVFDNFGAVMLARATAADARELLDYVARQDAGRSTRTIHYLDLLGTTERGRATASVALASYLADPPAANVHS